MSRISASSCFGDQGRLGSPPSEVSIETAKALALRLASPVDRCPSTEDHAVQVSAIGRATDPEVALELRLVTEEAVGAKERPVMCGRS
jgi:hypothetical protein